MNANAIFVGGEYAFTDFPSRNRAYYPGAKRVRVMHVYKLEDPWRQKRQTLVECVVLDNETGERAVDSYGKEINVKTIRARQIVSSWEEHLAEKARHEEEEEKRRAKWQKEDQERRKRYEEEQRRLHIEQEKARQRREREDNKLYKMLASIGIPRSYITMNSYEIRISRHRLEEVLNDSGEAVGPTDDQEPSPQGSRR